MKEYIEPEVEIIEYSLMDVIASSVVTTDTSGNNTWEDPNPGSSSDDPENLNNDWNGGNAGNGGDNFFDP